MGIYVSRSLSYAGATFQLSELDLADEQKMMYNHAAEFWQFLFRVFFPVRCPRFVAQVRRRVNEDADNG